MSRATCAYRASHLLLLVASRALSSCETAELIMEIRELKLVQAGYVIIRIDPRKLDRTRMISAASLNPFPYSSR